MASWPAGSSLDVIGLAVARPSSSRRGRRRPGPDRSSQRWCRLRPSARCGRPESSGADGSADTSGHDGGSVHAGSERTQSILAHPSWSAWWRRTGSNCRPPGNEPGELPLLHVAVFVALSPRARRCAAVRPGSSLQTPGPAGCPASGGHDPVKSERFGAAPTGPTQRISEEVNHTGVIRVKHRASEGAP